MMRHWAARWIAAILFLHTSGAAFAAAPTAECRSFRVREQDQIWLVSTRHLGCAIGGKFEPTFQVSRYKKGVWQPASEAEFFAEDSAELLTPMYVHGNRIDSGLASSYGLSVYFELAGKLDHEPPVRFVIWSWPSDQIKGPLNDVRSKAARSDVDAFYLACFLARMEADVRLGLLGYSLGARIISGSLHLLQGGSLLGRTLAPSERPHIRVATWAAAGHNYWYGSGQVHGQALAAADAWYITLNPCDPVLARYRFVERCGDPVALGFAGIYGRNLLPPEVNARVEEINVANIVGSEHHWRPYLYSRYIQDRTRDYVLWHELSVRAHPEAAAVTAAE
jgi:hypothetical protein